MSAGWKAPSGAELHAAADPARDQSYFLFATTQAQLDYLRFPLGDMEKREVRAIAAELGLVNAAKPDSQDICFVPQGRYTTIVEPLRPDAARPGEIVDQAGTVLGRHDGITHFTVGQRKGLGLSGNDEPLFVLKLDAANARVVVGPRSGAGLVQPSLLNDVNWLAAPDAPVRSAGESALHAPAGGRHRDAAAGRRGAGGTGGAGRRHRAGPGLRLLWQPQDSRVLGGGWITAQAGEGRGVSISHRLAPPRTRRAGRFAAPRLADVGRVSRRIFWPIPM